MPIMLICALPDLMSDSDVRVSIVTFDCEPPLNLLHPIDLRQRRRIRQLSSSTNVSSDNFVDFTICVPPLFGNVRATGLIEFIEVSYTVNITYAKFVSVCNSMGKTLWRSVYLK